MNSLYLTFGAGLSILPLIVGGGLWFNRVRSDNRIEARFAALHRTGRSLLMQEAKRTQNLRSIALRAVSGVGDWVLSGGLLPTRTRDDVEAMLRGAGYSGGAALRLFVGAKILLAIMLPAGLWLATDAIGFAFLTRMLFVAGGAIGGLIGPDMVIRNLRNGHMKKVRNEIPDALDMMVICAQAGLGMGTTIIRVAHELQHSHRAIALELAHCANELQMMTDSKIPLLNLGNRCGVESAKRLSATLLQSAQYGTPLTDALRGLAAELRTELITRFEARAARMPVLLTMPMVVFILPSVFLIIGGPAVIQVIHAIN